MIATTISAQKSTGFARGTRPIGDFYASPKCATTALLQHEIINGPVLEPACGNGAISKVLECAGIEVISHDLYDWGYGVPGIDFLSTPIIHVPMVITNPPFKFIQPFAAKALQCVESTNGKVMILARLQWLEGIKRKPFFEQHLTRVLVFSRRLPRMNRYDYTGKQGTSLISFAWFILQNTIESSAKINWIDWKVASAK